MNFDDPRPANSGDTKLSEVAVDRAIPLITGSAPQDNALVTAETAFRAITELARRQNFILRSEGSIQWNGTEIRFDSNALANSIDLEILASEGSVNPAFTVRLQGSTVSNTATTFLNLPMADGDLLYLELDSTQLVDLGASFDLGNGVNGGSIATGLRVLSTPMSTAMPKLQIGISGGGSLFYIPLALRRGTDLFWIPHGIRWPSGTTSGLGAVIVEGIEAYPERFVDTQADLLTAISDMAGQGGGVILIDGPFSVSQTIVVSSNIKILGRGVGKNTITMLAGSQFQLGAGAELANIDFVADAARTGSMVLMNSTKAQITNCYLDISAQVNSAISSRAVQVTGSWNRLYNCTINGVVTPSIRVGVLYSGGTNNADIDTTFT